MSISARDKTLFVWSALRISLGFIFLWAFLDKFFGLGFSTCRDAKTDAISTMCSKAWAEGGSPTAGFLGNAVKGPLSDFYHGLAGSGLVEWAFMLGLLVTGVGLIFGLWVRLAAVIGSAMMLLMWSALLWPENNPMIDDHIIYIIVLIGVYLTADQQKWSLSSRWANTAVAKSLPFLK